MQKWEYCRISFGPVVQHAIFMRPDGLTYQELPHESGNTDGRGISAMYRFIAQLGQDGWEMVGSAIDLGGEAEAVWLKRPLS